MIINMSVESRNHQGVCKSEPGSVNSHLVMNEYYVPTSGTLVSGNYKIESLTYLEKVRMYMLVLNERVKFICFK